MNAIGLKSRGHVGKGRRAIDAEFVAIPCRAQCVDAMPCARGIERQRHLAPAHEHIHRVSLRRPHAVEDAALYKTRTLWKLGHQASVAALRLSLAFSSSSGFQESARA